MPTLPLHPAIVHVPLGLAFLVPFLAAGLLLAYRRRALPRAAFVILAAVQALLVLGGVIAMEVGERDEQRVESVVGEAAVETHEERGEVFVWAAGAVLAGAVAILVVPAGAIDVLAGLVLAATVAVAGLGVRAGEAGAALVYQHGGAAAFASGGAAAGAALAHPGRAGRAGEDDD